MALNINGTTGISGVDGSASAPAVTGTDSNTGINFGSDTVKINTGGTTRVNVDSSGKVGIGITSPVTQLHSEGSGNQNIRVSSSTHNNFLQMGLGSGDTFHEYKTQYRLVDTDHGERMRITSAGIVDVSGGVIVHSTSNPSIDIEQQTVGNYTGVSIRNFYDQSGRKMIVFLDNNGNVVGSIVNDGSGITYNTTSDYRLKENVVSISDGITRLKTLKPYRFNFKADATETLDGFLAHEVTAVPEAINGTKDAVVTQEMIDKNEYKSEQLGDNINQGLDLSKLVPLLTAALQEAIAKIEVLETKVAALEAG